jgi:hypothetical protein
MTSKLCAGQSVQKTCLGRMRFTEIGNGSLEG